MDNIRIVLAPTYDMAKEYAESHNVIATVEAEYGRDCVEGSMATLAHHGNRSANPAPCNDSRAVPASLGQSIPDPVILVSHLDLDAIGGLMGLMGNKFDNAEFWKAAEYIDINGPQRMGGTLSNGKNRYMYTKMDKYVQKQR